MENLGKRSALSSDAAVVAEDGGGCEVVALDVVHQVIKRSPVKRSIDFERWRSIEAKDHYKDRFWYEVKIDSDKRWHKDRSGLKMNIDRSWFCYEVKMIEVKDDYDKKQKIDWSWRQSWDQLTHARGWFYLVRSTFSNQINWSPAFTYLTHAVVTDCVYERENKRRCKLKQGANIEQGAKFEMSNILVLLATKTI